jgi:hypothetical protein
MTYLTARSGRIAGLPGEPVTPGAQSTKTASRATVLRVATHLAVWIPLLTVVAGSMRGNWHVVGDGAEIAWHSWNTLAGQPPLVGQPTRLGHNLYDPGPLEYWLLAVPVHIDPVRGVLWGAALWCMAAASLAIEATRSILGQIGGMLTGGLILAMIEWSPALALKPYWNPCFGALFFAAALAASWAVMSGRCQWWPAVVVTASTAAQAHLMFAIASVALALLALTVGLVARPGAKSSYRWVAGGLIAGMVCWSGPLIQQFTSRPGNLTALASKQAGPYTGFVYALKAFTAFTQPAPLWWAHPAPNLGTLIEGRSPVWAAAILAITSAAMFLAVLTPGQRPLASLAGITLVVSAAALLTFSRIPLTGISTLPYLALAMFPAGLLAWLTIGSASMLTAQHTIKRIRVPAAHASPHPGRRAAAHTRWAASTAALALIVLALPAATQQALRYPGDARRAGLVSAATSLIERTIPRQPIALSATIAGKPDRRLRLGLQWALTSDGYQLNLSPAPRHSQRIPHVSVLIRGNQITVELPPRRARLTASNSF